MRKETKKVILLYPGPKYDVEHNFKYRLEKLSEYFEGIVFTSTSEAINVYYGNFNLITKNYHENSFIFKVTFFLSGVMLAIKKRLKGEKIDLVVSYDPLYIGLIGLCMARILGAQFITEVNGDYADKNNYIDQKNKFVSNVKRFFYVKIIRFVLRRADGIRLLYPTQIDYCRDNLKAKIISLFDFTDIRLFKNLGEDKVILFAGFPFHRKGVDILVDAFKKIAIKHPDWKLKILGWFPDRTELDACIAGHPQIIFHPPVNHVEMCAHMGKCAIFVLPSRSEAMGRVLLEAMAAGKPRVGSNVGGIPAVIDDQHDGLLFESENIDQLALALDSLMSDATIRKKLGDAGFKRAENEYTDDKYFVQIAALYNAVIDYS